MPKGSEWNEEVRIIPAGIFITTRQEVPVMESLDGFARGLNTIHGFILKINQMLLSGDVHTRDSHTVQGAINVINDIIAKFEIIAPGQFVIIDDYGRVHSTPHTTKQSFTATSYIHGDESIINEDNEKEDRWIKLEVNSNVKDPKIIIEHIFTSVDGDDTIIFNCNNEENQDSGKLKLYTPIVDSKGHVVGKNIETIELPHNFKTITVGDTDTTVITANNHIANMNIKDDNSWIEVSADTDTLTISHIGPVSEEGTTTYNTDDKPIFGATFSDPTITYDLKGHISATDKYQITLPTLSLVDNTSGNVLT